MSLYDAVKNSEFPVKAYRDAITDNARRNNILSSALLELSPICNFTCPFCYARKSKEELKQSGDYVRPFSEWKRIIDELYEMKVPAMTLTGGECMLYPDFTELYRYAYSKNFGITLLSNCSLLTDDILNMLKEFPPECIYATMYGGCEETYEKVCGNRKFYETVKKNLKRVVDNGINLVIQFTANEDNLDDMENISLFAKEINVPFQHTMDLISYRRCNGDMVKNNTKIRDKYTDIAAVIEKAKHPQDIKSIPGTTITPVMNPTPIKKGMPCSGGVHSCAFTYALKMQPCITFNAVSVDTCGKKISDCWKELIGKCSEIPRLKECANCIHRAKCRSCIAMHYNDTHEYGKPSPRLCYKQTHPERAKEIEDFFNEHGYILPEMEEI